ncbi:hypothetical protein BHUM_01496c [Candidatus Burkholderia humilis]|nr:hypothetical protein BHUM_01496c [Candidatus Burkholderia humilis]
MGQFDIDVQRVYEPLPGDDAKCFLVDRLWPRHVDWASAALRKWLHDGKDDATHWIAFVQRYKAELNANPEGWRSIVEASAARHVLLLYDAHDTQHNHVIVLRDYLLKQRRYV